MADNDSPEFEIPVALERSLGVVSTCMLGLGAMIGAGIFVLIGHATALAGPGILLALVLNAGFAVTVGACYAELAVAFPRTGGAYVWVGEAFGRRVGFLTGFCCWGAQMIACALYTLGFGAFGGEILERTSIGVDWLTSDPDSNTTQLILGLVLLAGLTAINTHGARDTGRAGAAVTGIKIALLCVLVAAGALALAAKPDPTASFRPFLPEGINGVLMAMGIIFIAFEGFEIIAQTREEIVAPARTIPRAIFAAIGVGCLLYVTVAIAMLGAIEAPTGIAPHTYIGSLGEMGLVETAKTLLPGGEALLLIAGLASTASALNATLYSASRIALAMGRGGDLPEQIRRVHPKYRTPIAAIGLTSLGSTLAASLLPLRDVAAAANLLFFVVFMSVAVALVALRRSRPAMPRPFRVPLVPWWPGTAIVGGIVLALPLLELSPIGWASAAAWLGIGVLLSPREGEGR